MEIPEIKEIIRTHLPNAQIFLESDDGRHFTAIVVAVEFRGKSRLDQQKLVYAALETQMADGSIHAFSLKTYTPEEY